MKRMLVLSLIVITMLLFVVGCQPAEDVDVNGVGEELPASKQAPLAKEALAGQAIGTVCRSNIDCKEWEVCSRSKKCEVSSECKAECARPDWVGDTYCDNGKYYFQGKPVYCDSAACGYDGGDCQGISQATNGCITSSDCSGSNEICYESDCVESMGFLCASESVGTDVTYTATPKYKNTETGEVIYGNNNIEACGPFKELCSKEVGCTCYDPDGTTQWTIPVSADAKVKSTTVGKYYGEFKKMTDSCKGNELSEYSCLDGVNMGVYGNDCPSGTTCSNGACI